MIWSATRNASRRTEDCSIDASSECAPIGSGDLAHTTRADPPVHRHRLQGSHPLKNLDDCDHGIERDPQKMDRRIVFLSVFVVENQKSGLLP
jgi:hypothetical protein